MNLAPCLAAGSHPTARTPGGTQGPRGQGESPRISHPQAAAGRHQRLPALLPFPLADASPFPCADGRGAAPVLTSTPRSVPKHCRDAPEAGYEPHISKAALSGLCLWVGTVSGHSAGGKCGDVAPALPSPRLPFAPQQLELFSPTCWGSRTAPCAAARCWRGTGHG